MAEKALDIKVRAVDEATGVFGKIGQRVQEFRRSVNATESRQGGIGDIAKSLGDLEKITKVVKTVEIAAVGAKAAFDGFRGITQYISGDIEAAGRSLSAFKEQAQQVPMGIGKAFGLGNTIGEYLFGDERDAKKAMAEIDKIDKRVEELRKRHEQFKKAQGSLIDFTAASENQARVEGLTGFAQAAEQAEQDYLARQKQIRAVVDAQIKAASNEKQIQQAESDAREAFEAAYAAHTARMARLRQADMEDAAKKAQEREAKEYETNATMLRLMEEDQRERAAVKEKELKQQQDAITKQQDLARSEFRDRLAGSLAPSVESRFLTGVTQSARERAGDDAAKQLRQTNSILQMALEALRGIQSGVENQTLVGVAE